MACVADYAVRTSDGAVFKRLHRAKLIEQSLVFR